MKTIAKILFLCGIIVLTAFSCEKEDIPELSDFVEGYLVGSFKGTIVESNGKSTPRAYCILFATNKSDTTKIMDYYTFNLPESILDIPQEVFTKYSDSRGWGCGPEFFVDSLQTKYKICFRYRILSEDEKLDFGVGPCSAFPLAFPWEEFKEISVKDVTKVEN